MRNHVHLLLTLKSSSSAENLLKRLVQGNISTEHIEERGPYGKEGLDPAWFKKRSISDKISIMLGRRAFPGKTVRPRTKKR